MALIDLRETYLVGVDEIDTHIKQFISLLNLIGEEVAQGGSAASWQALLSTLVSLGQFHFAYEESFMRNREHPALMLHKEDHDAFLSRASSARTLVGEGRDEFLEYAAAWAHRHFTEGHLDLKQFGGEPFFPLVGQ